MNEHENIDLISVIVPCYNVEKYLKFCVDSIISQTYKNIEIFLVDDNSTDGTRQIINEYAKADGRVKAIYHEKNMGISISRYDGYLACGGGWICFVDSDDAMHPRALEWLAREIDGETDIIAGKSVCASEERFEKYDWDQGIDGVVAHVLELDEAMEDISVSGVTWSKIYRKELFAKTNVFRYREEFPLEFFDDSMLPQAMCIASRKTKIVDRCIYLYRVRPDSISHNSSITKKEKWLQQLNAYDITLGWLKPNNAYLHGMEAQLLQAIKVWYMLDRYENGRVEDLRRAEDIFNKWYLRYKSFKGEKNFPTNAVVHLFAFSKSLCCMLVCRPWFSGEAGIKWGKIRN